jgi:hypothetical protein
MSSLPIHADAVRNLAVHGEKVFGRMALRLDDLEIRAPLKLLLGSGYSEGSLSGLTLRRPIHSLFTMRDELFTE